VSLTLTKDKTTTYNKKRHRVWLQRIGRVLIKTISDENLEGDKVSETAAKTHRLNDLLERLDKWSKTRGQISWHR
jgi:hypothetical protein